MTDARVRTFAWRIGKPGPFTDERPALIFADPPYNIGVGYDGDPTGDRMPTDEYGGLMRHVMHECARSLRPGGTLWWLCPVDQLISAGVIMQGIEAPGRTLDPVIWYETFAQYQSRRLTRDYRVIHRWQAAGPATFNPDEIRIESERQRMGDKRADPRGRVPGLVWKIRRLQGTSTSRKAWHPCQLPPELLERIVLGWTRPGDLVGDAFAGSGSTGVACLKHGRRFYGVDRSAKYAREARQHMKSEANRIRQESA